MLLSSSSWNIPFLFTDDFVVPEADCEVEFILADLDIFSFDLNQKYHKWMIFFEYLLKYVKTKRRSAFNF